MPDQLEPDSILREITDLEDRIGELRQAAGMPAPDLRATLDAALVELELALEALRTLGADQSSSAGRSAAAETERRVLRTVFQDAPVPLFLIDRDTSVRRVNRQAAALLGTSPGYVSGKQFTAFCDLATRAALRSQLAGVVRTGRRRRVPVRLLGRERPVDAVVTLARVWIRGEPDPMVVAVAGAAAGAGNGGEEGRRERNDTAAQGASAKREAPAKAAPREPAAPGGSSAPSGPLSAAPPAATARGDEDAAVATLVHRMDVLANAAELLLDEPVFNETVAVRRCARLLAAELADWAIVDLVGADTSPQAAAVPWQPGDAGPPDPAGVGGGRLQRQVVMGPDDERSVHATQMIEKLDPSPGTLPASVFTTRQSALRPHIEDLELLGTGPDGQPVCGTIGATTTMCVPIEEGDRCLGTITLASSGEHGPFDLMDLAVVQRLGRYLALVIRAARLYRRRAEVAETLQSSLLPRRLPAIPGVEVAAHYTAATHGAEVGGDFYDVFRTGTGWGLVLGDVCGKGEDAAAVTATARHGVRLMSRWRDDPTEVLAAVNHALLDEDRFVTAVMAALKPGGDRVTITVGTAGHPPALVVRADGVIRTASRGGLPLGLFDDFEAGLDTLDLGPGDTLFLHSDGVLEACDLNRREFGQERLLEILAGTATASVQEMLDAVERALLEFCDGDLRDDVSMLALRVLPRELA
ncbi:SpoIIE family protein phosphatase [Spirillospora sp. NPDC029432]|uniref:SpoIIE family protein phosphatase n=1 Tax=Spirillospora sp. NPDC029432 TaxID=3154599 RepID=UPI0034556C36